MKETILIAEDDADIRDLLRLYLESEGFSVIEARDGEEAMRKANSAAPDLAILDVMMPRMNGLELTKALRRVSAIPILILSARSTDNDKILGLNLGADDYIAKPFGVLELIARVNAALRRANKSSVIRTGQLVMNTENMSVTYKGEELDLSNKEFQLLKYFMQNEGKVLPRETILSDVWGYDGGETRTLDNHIARLRKAGLNFETVFGVGYKFIAD